MLPAVVFKNSPENIMKSSWKWHLQHSGIEACGTVVATDLADAANCVFASPLVNAIARFDAIDPTKFVFLPCEAGAVVAVGGGTLRIVRCAPPGLPAHVRCYYPDRFFRMTEAGDAGDGTVGGLINWMSRYIDIVLPGNGVEYWHDNAHRGTCALKPTDRLAQALGRSEDVHHVAAYVRHCRSEGLIVELLLYMRDGTWKTLGCAKISSARDGWTIAHACHAALEEIVMRQRVPSLVSMAARLPRCAPHELKSLLLAAVIEWSGDSVVVRSADRSYLVDYRKVRTEEVEECVTDWHQVLTSREVNVVIQACANPCS